MRILLTLFAFVAVLLVALSAGASDWRSCKTDHKDGDPITDGREILQPSGLRVACYDVDDATDSEILNVMQCENVDVRFNPDIDGSDTTGTVNVMGCVNSTANTNACSIIENTTLDGDESTSTDVINGAGEAWIWVDTQTDPSGGDARVLVVCNP